MATTENALKVWAVTLTEFGVPESIVYDGNTALLFAKYVDALNAFRKVVKDRLGTDVEYSYPDQLGYEVEIDVTRASEEQGDTYSLRPYDIIGG